MAKFERLREAIEMPPSAEDWRRKTAEGWRPVAIEWEREAEGGDAGGPLRQEVPYGLRVADDCRYLEEHPEEMETLRMILEQIVQDRSLSAAAGELDRRGFRQRGGARWDQVALFNLLPRIVEVAPRIYSTEEWNERRAKLRKVVG